MKLTTTHYVIGGLLAAGAYWYATKAKAPAAPFMPSAADVAAMNAPLSVTEMALRTAMMNMPPTGKPMAGLGLRPYQWRM